MIVRDRTAKPATSLAHLREALGVQVSDALTAADVMVVCEGEHDSKTLPLLLAQRDSRVTRLIAEGRLVFESAGGGSKIYGRVLAARTMLVEPIVVLDSDPAGQRDVQKLMVQGQLDQTRIVQIRRQTTEASELEDLFILDSYVDAVERTIGFSLSKRQRGVLDRGHDNAWSDRLEGILVEAGVPDAGALVNACKGAMQRTLHVKLESGETVVRAECEGLLDRLLALVQGSFRS